jgi:hypothetical protein
MPPRTIQPARQVSALKQKASGDRTRRRRRPPSSVGGAHKKGLVDIAVLPLEFDLYTQDFDEPRQKLFASLRPIPDEFAASR